MQDNVYVYIFVMAAVSYAIRALPVTLIRGRIRSPFLQSFLYYVPYVTLSVMTFPAIIEATQTPLSGALAADASLPSAFCSPSAAAIAVIVQSITSKSSMLTAFFPYLFIFLLLLPQDSHKGFSSNYTTDPVIKQQAAVGVDKLPLPVYIRLIYYAIGFFIAERQAWSSSKPQRNTENVLFWPV